MSLDKSSDMIGLIAPHDRLMLGTFRRYAREEARLDAPQVD
jgi:hypothetical protein